MSDQLYVVVGNRGFEPSDTDGVVPWLWESSEGAKLKADHLNKFESTKEYYPAAVFIVRKEWVEAVQSRADELDRLRAENERLRAANARLLGSLEEIKKQFSGVAGGHMAEILARAALQTEGDGKNE